MFNVSVFLRNSAVQFLFAYETHAAAYDARENYRTRRKGGEEFVLIKDDFGMECELPTADIQAFLVEDQDKSMDAGRERDIAKRQEQKRFMDRRQNNIELMHLYPAAAPQGGFQNAG